MVSATEQCEVTLPCPSRYQCVSCLCQSYVACGDGFVDAGEECDDGNLSNGDGCNAFCGIEQIEGNAFCGNGITEQGEQCDDGNLLNGDGCSTFCQWEQRLAARCGDGFLDPSEECDDGNYVNGDDCTLHCQWENLKNCGNNIIESPQEQCDDGNQQNGDGCSARCQWEHPIEVAGGDVCGDGIIAALEQCDDGLYNGALGNPCSLSCTLTSIGCIDSSQCLAGYVCVDGQCDLCTQNNQCPTHLCIMGVCSSCTTNDQCPTGLCVNGMCVPCSGDDDCAWGQTCRNGSCLPCAEDAQCTTGRCSAGLCLPCSQNDQCWTNLCLNGVCTVCSANEQCAPGQICRAGWCADVPAQVAGTFVSSAGGMTDDLSHAAGDAMSFFPVSTSPQPQELHPSLVVSPVRRSDSISPLFATIQAFEPWGRTIRTSPQGPAGETGPASVAIMTAGAAAGLAWMRRKRRG